MQNIYKTCKNIKETHTKKTKDNLTFYIQKEYNKIVGIEVYRP